MMRSSLLPVAKTMADLLTTVDFSDVKGCEWHTCTLLFVDTTRGRMRRWCNMAVCGNRAKQAAHRGRAVRQRKAGSRASSKRRSRVQIRRARIAGDRLTLRLERTTDAA